MNTHTYTHLLTHTRIHTYACTHSHIRAHTQTHTNTQAHTHSQDILSYDPVITHEKYVLNNYDSTTLILIRTSTLLP